MAAYILSEEQRRIIDYRLSHDGPMLVEASAGSGKTRVLTECVRQLIERNPKRLAKILCLTFTNKAAEEMAERLSDIYEGNERTFIGTIHSFALEILQSKWHELGYNEMPHILDHHSNQIAILRDVILESEELSEFFDDERTEKQFLDKNLAFISERKKNLVVVDNETLQHKDFSETQLLLFKEYNHRLRNQNLVDFDDVLLLAWRILIENPSAADLYRRLYKYVLVDEAQDLSKAQYELIRALCGDVIRNILMVGDGNQAIHGYAGADQRFMKVEFRNDFKIPDEACMRIESNYRSSKAVIDCANIIAGRNVSSKNAFYEGEVKFYRFIDEVSEAQWVVEKIHALLVVDGPEFDGPVTLEKIAVLARNKFVFNVLIEQLNNDEILRSAYTIKKGAESLDPASTFMKVFDLGTRIIANPYGEVYIAQMTGLLRITESIPHPTDGLVLLEEIKKRLPSTSILKESFQVLFDCWTKMSKRIDAMSGCLDALKVHASILEPEEEREYATRDLEEWSATWGKYIQTVPAESKSLSDFRRHASLGISISPKQQGLTLATVHTAKGLEFPIVFLIGMEQGTFPDYRATIGKAFEEERNNAYVAVTRAKRRLYMSYAINKMMPWGSTKRQEPSVFLNKFDCTIPQGPSSQ